MTTTNPVSYILTPKEENLALTVFLALDNDSDGILSHSDFAPTELEPVSISRANNVHQLFQLFDTDKDQSITKTEYLNACTKLISIGATNFDTRTNYDPEEQMDMDAARERTARQYLWNTLLNITFALSNDSLNGTLPIPPPPNRLDSAVSMVEEDDVGNTDDNEKSKTSDEDIRFPVIGEEVLYTKVKTSPRSAIVVGIHPFSDKYDPLYTVKLIEENLELETYAIYLQIVGNKPIKTKDIDQGINLSNQSKDDDGDVTMNLGQEDDDLYEYITPKAYLPETEEKPPLCILSDASRDAAFSLYRLLLKYSSNGENQLFYPHHFVTSSIFTELNANMTDSIIIDFFSNYKQSSKATDSLSFDEILKVTQQMGQMYTNQKWQLRQHYQPSDRRTPRTNHIVALANVSIVDHLSSLESLIRMGLKTLSPASSGSPASKSSTSSSSTTSSTNQQMIEFIMDQQTERDIRELFRKLDKDGDNEIEWFKDYIAQSPNKNFTEYDLARFKRCLTWFDKDGDNTISFAEFKTEFQLRGYKWVANRKIHDSRKSSASLNGKIPKHMLTNEYNVNLQNECNSYVRSSIKWIHDYVFTDLVTQQMIDGVPLTFRPDASTTKMMNHFWAHISQDKEGLQNYMIQQKMFQSKYRSNLRHRQIDYFYSLFDIDRNGKLDQHEVNQVWMIFGKSRLNAMSRLNLDWGPIRLQTQINEELRKRIQLFVNFLRTPYDGNYPGDPGWTTNVPSDHLIVPGNNDVGSSVNASQGDGNSSNHNSPSKTSTSSSSTSNTTNITVQSLFTLTEQTNQFINRQFFEFDHDNDSIISQHDFERGAPTVQRFKIIELFKHFDHNNDGQITREEFLMTLKSQAHWFLKRRDEVQQRQRALIRMDLDQLLLKLKCRDLEEYQNVFAAQQSGSSSAQKGYSGTYIREYEKNLETLIANVKNCAPGHYFTGAFSLSLTNEDENPTDRIRPPLTRQGLIDVIDDSNQEFHEIVLKVFKQLDTDGDDQINAGDFNAELTAYQRQIKKEIFQSFDLDMDRNIKLDEMVKAVKQAGHSHMSTDEGIKRLANSFIVHKLKEIQYFLKDCDGTNGSTDNGIIQPFLNKLNQWTANFLQQNGCPPTSEEIQETILKFARNGNGGKGNKNKYDGGHDDGDGKKSKKEYNEKKEKGSCHNWDKKGDCKHGDKCKFKHNGKGGGGGAGGGGW